MTLQGYVTEENYYTSTYNAYDHQTWLYNEEAPTHKANLFFCLLVLLDHVTN